MFLNYTKVLFFEYKTKFFILLQHVSSLELASSEVIQVYNNSLFSIYKSAVYKWNISLSDQTFQKTQVVGWRGDTGNFNVSVCYTTFRSSYHYKQNYKIKGTM